MSLSCLQESNAACLPWIPGSHGNCMWISSLQEGSGIITPLLKVRRAGVQYILIICSTVSEQMCQRESSECTFWLCLGWQLSCLLCYYSWRRNANPKGRETGGPIPNCCSFYLCATFRMSCVGSKQAIRMPKLKPCTPASVWKKMSVSRSRSVYSGVQGFAGNKGLSS